jgi:5'-deoxynucleotidase YfbR-like HD superfamily hydrolase
MNIQPAPGTLYAGNYIRAFSGVYVNVFDPHPDTLLISDIAEGLAYNYRWGGHSKSKITVAEHSCRVAMGVDAEYMLEALLHDATEAYLGDMASPIKKGMPDYQRVENNMMHVMAIKFRFKHPLQSPVKRSDLNQLHREFEDCVLTKNSKALTPIQAKKAFLRLYKTISAL